MILPIGGLGIDNNVQKLSYRIVIFIICVFGACVFWSYNAVLVSLLTVSSSKLPINSLDDLYKQVDNGYTLMLMTGTAAYNYFDKARLDTNPDAWKIYQVYLKGNMYCTITVIGNKIVFYDFLITTALRGGGSPPLFLKREIYI